MNFRVLTQMLEQDTPRKVTGTDQGDSNAATRRLCLIGRQNDACYRSVLFLRRCDRILQQYAQMRLPIGEDQFVRLDGVVDWKPVSRTDFWMDLSGRDQIEERFEVPLLGPAHVADRIVVAMLFV